MNPTPEAVQLIRKMLKAGIGHTKIAATAGVSTYIIIRIDEHGGADGIAASGMGKNTKDVCAGLEAVQSDH